MSNDKQFDNIFMVIGHRDRLTKREADYAATAWRLARQQYPDTPIAIAVDGYDDDERELWEFPEICRYIRRWAKQAGVDGNATAAALAAVPVIPPDRAVELAKAQNDFAAFLAVCGVFGPVDPVGSA